MSAQTMPMTDRDPRIVFLRLTFIPSCGTKSLTSRRGYCLSAVWDFQSQPINFLRVSAEDALRCLLAEIVSWSGDISILDWVGEPSSFHTKLFPSLHYLVWNNAVAPLPARRAITDGGSASCAVQSIAKALWLTHQIIPPMVYQLPPHSALLILSCRRAGLPRGSDTTPPSHTHDIQVV
ncbi:hypothetical protein EDD16DRAFT_1016474 [Pisolithus croceorrhizus]|nr:hypothetical protein EDD16DRAFT_1016474 [Pisolithus croceorrhizus]